MESTSAGRNRSIAGRVIINTVTIVENILKYLDNSDLMNCLSVSPLWKKISNEILSVRLVVIKKEIPFDLYKRAIAQPDLILPYLGLREYAQFVSEFCQYYDRNLFFGRTRNSSVVTFLTKRYIMDSYKLDPCQFLTPDRMMETNVAIFPSLVDVYIHHFSFSTEQFLNSGRQKLSNLTGLRHRPDDEVQCLLLFMNEKFDTDRYSLPDIDVPTIVISSFSSSEGKFHSDNHCGLAFCGYRVNAFILREWDKDTPFLNTKQTFMKYVDKLKHQKIHHHRSVALMISSFRCRCERRKGIYSLFKEKFPNIPMLFFSDVFIMDLETVEREENLVEGHRRHHPRPTRPYPVPEKIVLIWFN